MLSTSQETDTFESFKPELLREHHGDFALVCGEELVGVHASLELALKAAWDAFDQGMLAEGAPILITEIAEPPKVRVMAQPRLGARRP